jgi:hypothetical protein
MSKKTKIVALQVETWSALQDLGTMKDTFDSVINRLISEAKKWRKVENEFLPSLPDYIYKEDSARFARDMLKWFKKNGLLNPQLEEQFKAPPLNLTEGK